MLKFRAFSIGIVAALLTACGGSQSPIGAPGVMPQTSAAAKPAARSGSWMLPEAKGGDLIYVSSPYTVGIYSVSGSLVGVIKNVLPTGLCSDASGNVWVTDGGSVQEYAHGATTPVAELDTPGVSNGCAVDPTTGDLAVADIPYGSHPGNVAVYTNAQGSPAVYTDSDFVFYYYCGYDDQGNLFVTGARGAGGHTPGLLAELPSASNTLTTISLNKTLQGPGAVQWDGHYLAIGDDYAHVVYQVVVSGGSGTVHGATYFSRWKDHAIEQFWIQGNTVLLPFPFHGTKIGFYRYPAGGKPLRLFSPAYVFHYGVTISVAASR